MTQWSPYDALAQEPFKVALKRGDFVDLSRDGRTVPYKIYYPIDHNLKTMPVIIWSHGFGGNRDGASFISRFLSSHGYVIVHITHQGTDSSLWEGQPGHPWDILRQVKIPRSATLNRMRDVPFVLDSLKEWALENPDIGPYMDFDRIGMSGHSFGAMTTQVMGGMLFPDENKQLQFMGDKRFKAGILYSPVPISHLTEAAPSYVYGGIDIPMLHLTGTEDSSPLEGYDYEARLVVGRYAGHAEQYLQILEDGDHMVYNGTRGKLALNPLRDAHEREINAIVYAFWQTYLNDNADAREWLKAHEFKR